MNPILDSIINLSNVIKRVRNNVHDLPSLTSLKIEFCVLGNNRNKKSLRKVRQKWISGRKDVHPAAILFSILIKCSFVTSIMSTTPALGSLSIWSSQILVLLMKLSKSIQKVSLLNLPPDIVRMIIPMADKPHVARAVSFFLSKSCIHWNSFKECSDFSQLE